MPIIRLLLDNNVPSPLIPLLRSYAAVHASSVGWAGLRNGDLLRLADEHGFGVLLTGDKNLRYQQNLRRVGCAIIALSTHHWPTIRENVAELIIAIEAIQPGAYVTVAFPRPPLRRRPYPSLDG